MSLILIPRVRLNLPILELVVTWMRQERFGHHGQAQRHSCQYPFKMLYLIFLHDYPERITGEVYDESSDVWSLGLTLYYCATGNFPFVDNYSKFSSWDSFSEDVGYWELFFCIKNNPIPDLPPAFSREFNDFVRLCMKKEPSERPSVSVLLQHPFVTRFKSLDVCNSLRDLVIETYKLNQEDLAHETGESVVQDPQYPVNAFDLTLNESYGPMDCPDLMVMRNNRETSTRLQPIPENEAYSDDRPSIFLQEEFLSPPPPISSRSDTTTGRMLAWSLYTKMGNHSVSPHAEPLTVSPQLLVESDEGTENPLDEEITIEDETDQEDSRCGSRNLSRLLNSWDISDFDGQETPILSDTLLVPPLDTNPSSFPQPHSLSIQAISLEGYLKENENNSSCTTPHMDCGNDMSSTLNVVESVRSTEDAITLCDSLITDGLASPSRSHRSATDNVDKTLSIEPIQRHISLIDNDDKDMREVSEGEEMEWNIHAYPPSTIRLCNVPTRLSSPEVEPLNCAPIVDPVEEVVVDLSHCNDFIELSFIADALSGNRFGLTLSETHLCIADCPEDDEMDLDDTGSHSLLISIEDNLDLENPLFLDAKRSSKQKLMNRMMAVSVIPPSSRPVSFTQQFIRRWNAMVRSIRRWWNRRRHREPAREIEMVDVTAQVDNSQQGNEEKKVKRRRGCFKV